MKILKTVLITKVNQQTEQLIEYGKITLNKILNFPMIICYNNNVRIANLYRISTMKTSTHWS